MLENLRAQVGQLLANDRSGHGMAHINRVSDLALAFCGELPEARRDIVLATALLHDVDDYKLHGEAQARAQSNARYLLSLSNTPEADQALILDNIAHMGFSKRLKGIFPDSLEGKIVSDADMCDAMGTNAVLRTFAYGQKCGRAFLAGNENLLSLVDPERYCDMGSDSGVMHLCEKSLQLQKYMFTVPARREAKLRYDSLANFLRAYLRENNQPELCKQLEELLGRISSEAES